MSSGAGAAAAICFLDCFFSRSNSFTFVFRGLYLHFAHVFYAFTHVQFHPPAPPYRDELSVREMCKVRESIWSRTRTPLLSCSSWLHVTLILDFPRNARNVWSRIFHRLYFFILIFILFNVFTHGTSKYPNNCIVLSNITSFLTLFFNFFFFLSLLTYFFVLFNRCVSEDSVKREQQKKTVERGRMKIEQPTFSATKKLTAKKIDLSWKLIK